MSQKTDFGYKQETKSTDNQLKHRERLYELFNQRPMPDDQLMLTLGLYMRSSVLAKLLMLNEAYLLFKDVPGVVIEFGTWWGQNLVVLENLRAIYEPFNASRRVIGFDTFKGYPKVSGKDRASETIKAGGYTVSDNYEEYLNQLLKYHEENNVLGAIKKTQTIAGDVAQTVPKFFQDQPQTIVAFAYFDMALYEPTKVCLEAIKPHLVPGSVLMMDELNAVDYPGETVAFKEVFKDVRYKIKRSQYLTDRTFIILE